MKASATKTIGGAISKPPAVAPWATAQMVGERVEHLENAIVAATAVGGCDKEVQSLETQLWFKGFLHGP